MKGATIALRVTEAEKAALVELAYRRRTTISALLLDEVKRLTRPSVDEVVL